MKKVALVALALMASAVTASAKEASGHFDPESLHRLLQQKLANGLGAGSSGIAIDMKNPKKPLSNGWHYLDAAHCGWDYNGGNSFFFVTNGSTSVLDNGPDHALATALAIPCVLGNRLGYHIIDGVHYDRTSSFTYQ